MLLPVEACDKQTPQIVYVAPEPTAVPVPIAELIAVENCILT